MRSWAAVLLLLAAGAAGASFAAPQQAADPTLKNPAALNEQAPALYRARLETSQGVFVIEAHRDWAPLAADRFYNLVKHGFYDNTRFFRVLSGFMAQFGLSGDPEIQRAWTLAGLVDELHLAISPVLLGAGEALFAGLDLPQLGYRCTEHVPTASATHIVLTRQAG